MEYFCTFFAFALVFHQVILESPGWSSYKLSPWCVCVISSSRRESLGRGQRQWHFVSLSIHWKQRSVVLGFRLSLYSHTSSHTHYKVGSRQAYALNSITALKFEKLRHSSCCGFLFVVCFLVLGIEPRTSCVLGRCSTFELHPSSIFLAGFYFLEVTSCQTIRPVVVSYVLGWADFLVHRLCWSPTLSISCEPISGQKVWLDEVSLLIFLVREFQSGSLCPPVYHKTPVTWAARCSAWHPGQGHQGSLLYKVQHWFSI